MIILSVDKSKMISLAVNIIPTKIHDFDTFPPQVQKLAKEDPPMMKKLPVEVDVSEFLTKKGTLPHLSPRYQVRGDLALIAFH